MSYLFNRFQGIEEMRRRQRQAFIRSMTPLRKQSVAPAAEIALMTMAVHETRALERDSLGTFNVPDAPRNSEGNFSGVSFSAATVNKLIRAGRVEIGRYSVGGAPTMVTLKPM